MMEADLVCPKCRIELHMGPCEEDSRIDLRRMAQRLHNQINPRCSGKVQLARAPGVSRIKQ